LEDAGAYAVVLEAIPPDVAARVTRGDRHPDDRYRRGARECDGQVLVCTDLLGMGRGASPRFAKRFANLADAAVTAVQAYVAEVQAGTFPGPEHAYKPNAPAMTDEGRGSEPAPASLPH
jgi:3-methyl-2-oxobutanoate hydroxymethyltransferase